LSLVRQVHVSGHNLESNLAMEMNTYQGHDSRDRGYCGSGDNCSCDDRQHHSHPNRAELSRVSYCGHQWVELRLSYLNHDCRFRIRLPIGYRETMRFSARSPSPSPVRRCVFLDLYNPLSQAFL
jgi:hypothetical protein